MAAESLTHTAYLALRDMIITLELEPGALLSQEDLQARTGLGRTPIHQALQRLEHEEFVVIAPRRGAFVTNIDVSFVTKWFLCVRIVRAWVNDSEVKDRVCCKVWNSKS